MLTILSPAKSLDFNSNVNCNQYSLPDNLDKSELLINALKKKSKKKLSDMMNLSAQLAQLNYERYQEWNLPFTKENARQAVFAFKGDVYIGLDINKFLEEDLEYAQKHLRILSGLHGLLKPLDLIQPYRLEMGTQLKYRRRNNLYEFWGDLITESLQKALDEQGDETVVNLASDEYFKSINRKKINARIITPVFMDYKNGSYKFLSFFLKKARGAMARYILTNRVTQPEDIKLFNEDGYMINENMSEGDKYVFTRG